MTHVGGDQINQYGDHNIGKSVSGGPAAEAEAAVRQARALIAHLTARGHLDRDGNLTVGVPQALEAVRGQRESMPELFGAVRRTGGAVVLEAVTGTSAALIVGLVSAVVGL
ncbi:MAG TPA: hypothetical protein VFY17_05620 [Pilimelia sp.]|nr:hypothetical protein [Pilimelia sp.]